MPNPKQLNNLTLKRYPGLEAETFLAWNASDEYIIKEIKSRKTKYKRLLLIEDEFGAIGISLSADQIFFVNDSILSQKGIEANFQLNQKELNNISFLSPYDSFPPDIDLVVMKLPKVNNYCEFLLAKLNLSYGSNLDFIAGSMVKYLNSSIYELFQSYLFEFTYSLSWKKAKIITGKLAATEEKKEFNTTLNEFNLTLINYPNLFSAQKLDLGTRFLLGNFAKLIFPQTVEKIIDVGSANGILGLKLLDYLPAAQLWLTDITYSAYESAKTTIQKNNLDPEQIHLVIANSLDTFQPEFADLIISNPPFHDNHKVSITASVAILNDCYRVLKVDGVLVIVANKHLGYHRHLERIFGNVTVVAKSAKFVVITAVKRS